MSEDTEALDSSSDVQLHSDSETEVQQRPVAQHGVLFGELAVSERYVTPEQLNDAVRAQRRASRKTAKRLGNIMIRKGYLSIEQAKYLLRLQRLKDPIEGYKLLAKIGKGGMGVVYKAWQKSMKREVALKILSPRFAKSRTFKERFFREARLAGRLNHPNLIAGFDVGESNGHYFFAMELVDGKTLKEIVADDGVFEPERAAELIMQVAKAMEHYDQFAIIHRDIKPDNVIVTTEGIAKLGDLGLSKQLTSNCHITRYGKTLGTPFYISPELAVGQTMTDIRSDIYSLGATFYCILVGEPPFTGKSPTEIMAKHVRESPVPVSERRPEVPEELSHIVEGMMAKPIGRRTATPGELVKQLEEFLGLRESSLAISAVGPGASSPPAPPPVPEAPKRRPRRSKERNFTRPPARAKQPVAMLLGIGLVFVVVVLFLLVQAFSGNSEAEATWERVDTMLSERPDALREAIAELETIADDSDYGERARKRVETLRADWNKRAETEFAELRSAIWKHVDNYQFPQARHALLRFVHSYRGTEVCGEKLPDLQALIEDASETRFYEMHRTIKRLFKDGEFDEARAQLELTRDLVTNRINLERQVLLMEARRLGR